MVITISMLTSSINMIADTEHCGTVYFSENVTATIISLVCSIIITIGMRVRPWRALIIIIKLTSCIQSSLIKHLISSIIIYHVI